jgi:hypothetical protein
VTRNLFFICATALLSSHVKANESNLNFTNLLQKHVKHGLVNYSRLCSDPDLITTINQLSQTNPDTIRDRNNLLAFWINAYNAFTLKVICDNYPLKSINDLHFGGLVIGTVLKKTIWDKKFIEINKKEYSLNNIEHEIIRKQFNEPRAHFVLVCASIGCPPLLNEAFVGDKLNEQLEQQGKRFLQDSNKNVFDIDKKVARISKIFDWFDKDFGNDKKERLLFISRFLPGEIANDIRLNPEQWKVKHTKYNWDLNEMKEATN